MESELQQIAKALVGINEKMERFVVAIEATRKSNDEWMDGRVTIDALTHTALLNAVCTLSGHFDKWFELQNNPRVVVQSQVEEKGPEDLSGHDMDRCSKHGSYGCPDCNPLPEDEHER